MLDNLGKNILLTLFKGIIHLDKNEQINFDKWRGEISKTNARIKHDILDYLDVI